MPALAVTTGLFEAHLTVADLDRSMAFYRDVVGLEPALHVPERGAAFFWIGGPGRAMLGLWSIGSAPMGLSLHIALDTPLADVLRVGDRLRAAGLTPLSFFGEETDEPSVIGWMPAAAVYLHDPDGHLLEFLAMLDEPPRPQAGIVPWSQWEPAAVAIVAHAGDRRELRPLFEQAEDSAAALDASIDEGDVLVAVADGRVLGHVQLISAGGRCEIKNLAVLGAHRGRGLGRALVDAAVEAARGAGATTVTVSTAAADVGNLRFYQRCGFRLRSVERDAFTPATGYADDIRIDGVALRDRVWLDLPLDAP
jgi:ribosomal protein S18 acetylase RimI-like enzyme